VSIRTEDDALMLEIMRFADELVDQSTFDFPKASEVRPQELKMATQLVENLAEPFDPSQYKDEYRANLKKIINAKMKGKEIEYEEPSEPKATPVIDLMARLQASLDQGKKGKAAKKKPARKAPRKRKSA
jgi:DNA end-binding protein Ku